MSEVDIFSLLKKAAAKDHLGHALLLVSPSVSTEFFKTGCEGLSAFLLCTSESKAESFEACKICDSCRAFASAQQHEGAHPDLLVIRPESKVGYTVDQIKELRSHLSLKRSLSEERLLILENAEDLSASGGAPANALLKVLEEPRPKTRILLLSSRPEGLLATIRSRCQIFRVPQLAEESATMKPELVAWAELWKWLDRGAPEKEWPNLTLPANTDSFFKDRDVALEELKLVFAEAWKRSQKTLPSLSTDEASALLYWFQDFETLLSAIKGHGQSTLQWVAFKTKARAKTFL